MMPFFHGKIQYRNAGLSFEYTKEEWDNLRRATMEPIWFIEEFVTFLTDKGRRTVQLRPYQKDVLHMITDEVWDPEIELFKPKNPRVILMQSRQTAKTTSTVAAVAWYILNHTQRNVLLSSIKLEASQEVLTKLVQVLEELPFYMKPGIRSLSKKMLVLDNGCTVMCAATSDTPATGYTFHLVVIDEAARIPQTKIVNFWQSVFPTTSSSSVGQFVVMSTPKGRSGLFYDLYQGALAGTNGFVQKTVQWYEVPGRGEEWKKEKIQVFGEANFRQEFELSFDSDASKLLTPTSIKFMNRIKKFFTPRDIYGVPNSVSQKILWHPDFHPESLTEEDLVNKKFLLQIDTAAGQTIKVDNNEDPDWNVINIYMLEWLSPARIKRNRLGYRQVNITDCIRARQVGIYMDHEFNEEFSAEAAQHIVFTILKNGQGSYMGEIDNVRIMLEINFNGVVWIKKFMKHDLFYSQLILKTYHSANAAKKDYGFKTVSGQRGKGYWCEAGARLIEQLRLIISQDHEVPNQSSIQQMAAFGKNSKGVYKGECLHDDIAVTALFVSIVFEQEDFQMWVEDWFRMLAESANTSWELRQQLKVIGQLLDMYVTQTADDDYTEEDIMNLYGNAASGFGGARNSSAGVYPRPQPRINNRTQQFGTGQFGNNPFSQQGNTGYGNYSRGSRYNPQLTNPLTNNGYPRR